MTPKNTTSLAMILGSALFITGAVALCYSVWISQDGFIEKPSRLFSSVYPQSEKFQRELVDLRNSGALASSDERLISHSVSVTSKHLRIPEALLWCLLFQESRLNHLAGYESYRSATGLGQFSPYSFYEINHQLDRYQRNPSSIVAKLVGSDVRPIEAKRNDILHPSSYYNIRTAVAASALYLKNRKIHLQRTLESNQILYDPDILWLWAAIGYNKGTRGVLSIFNQLQRRGGRQLVERSVNVLAAFEFTTQDSGLLSASFRRVWPNSEADQYARELKLHATSIMECSLDRGHTP